MQKIPKVGGKRVFSSVFLNPSLPRLAFGSPGPPNCLGVKEPAYFRMKHQLAWVSCKSTKFPFLL